MSNKDFENIIKTQYSEIERLITDVHNLEKDGKLADKCRIPNCTYFLNDKEILCYESKDGNSRYLYANDGRILTTYATGGVCLQESTFNIILPSYEGKESNFAFFVGKKKGQNYFPVSVFNNSKQLFEDNVKRYTVFSPKCTYYFVEDGEFVSVVKIFLDKDKNVRTSFFIKNLTDKKLELYATTYLNCFLWSRECDNQWTKAYARSKKEKDGYLISVYENVANGKIMHYAKLLRSTHLGELHTTTSQNCFKGGKNNPLTASVCLKNGYFDQAIDCTSYKENPIAGDIITLELESSEIFNVNYTLSCGDNEQFIEWANGIKGEIADFIEIESNNDNVIGANMPLVNFNGATGKINDYQFNCFLANVFRQVETCAKSKNFAGQYLGTRDVFQQLEAALMWCPEYSRKKIKEAISFIFEDGRPPRQFSYPANEKTLPNLITAYFIDQGLWIIHTIYKYLAFTGDFSILDEKCGYYKFTEKVKFSNRYDSVLDHVIAICDYLISNLDDKTGCLKILDGDWNDSLNGLGKSIDGKTKFGTGVSVMATLQLYQALNEVSSILSKLEKKELSQKYFILREKLGKNILQNTVISNGDSRKILHGWGDKKSYLVGSYCDSDGEDRYSLTSASFFVLSGALDLDKSLRNDLLNMFKKLQAKYGLNTFNPAFSTESKGVGRIANMIKGTAENGATYNHSTLFGIWALFNLCENKLAWDNIEKVIPITHDKISTSPFIMPNSYIYNTELGLDGESGGDWYTGSACVLIKVLIYKIFGLECTLDELIFTPCQYMPFKDSKLEMQIRNRKVSVEYLTDLSGEKGIYLLSGNDKIKILLNDKNQYVIPFSELKDELKFLLINYHEI